MLEHISDPLKAIKKIYESMDKDSYFHVEVPIEPGLPRLQYAHMFPFHQQDLFFMLMNAGFIVIMGGDKTSSHEANTSPIERYLVKK